MSDARKLHLVDTTLRDGEQMAGLAFAEADKVACAEALDAAGIYQIEAGVPSMCKEEKNAIYKMLERKKHALISTWNRMNEADIHHSLDLGPDIIHIGVPVSDIQIREKLRKTRAFVEVKMRHCIELALSRGAEVTIGFEDASRADIGFITKLARQAKQLGVHRVRYSDTLGLCYPSRIGPHIAEVLEATGLKLEVHAHNDLGMAVANSLEAAKCGAEYIDTTVCGIGERAGNCNLQEFLIATHGAFAFELEPDVMRQMSEKIPTVLGLKIPASL